MGALLCADRPGAQRGAVLARGLVYGERFFTHLAGDPERVGAFQASMRDRSAREAAAVVAAYDCTGFGSIIDVGGGGGVLLTT
jgi:hypothetical protein